MIKKINKPEDDGTSPDHKNKINNITIPFYVNFKNSDRRFAEANAQLVGIYDYDADRIITGTEIWPYLKQLGIHELEVSYFV